ncbi:DNA helicase [Corchorus olitorius]|uniref:DNA helicase n=1 Tax=Corchorus olitorius TaxID=93759 RepID=A0A1R3KCQ7_9ROSI|nr:DNA helicase [Corchorus olitorius]
MERIPGNSKTYLSHDSISQSTTGIDNQADLYPLEILNKITAPGVADHELILKVGCVAMMMRNINQVSVLCNGTRLIILQLAPNVIEGKIITGDHLGEKVYILRILFTIKDNRWPFTLCRKQFPLKVSYAMTINKSQGQNLKFVGIFLPKPVFSHGQLYVALSRVTSCKGLKILIVDEEEQMTNITKNVVYTDIFDSIWNAHPATENQPQQHRQHASPYPSMTYFPFCNI